MRIWCVFLSFILMAFLAGTSRADKADDEYEEISKLLFPDTSSWQVVKKLAKPDPSFMKKLIPYLRKAYTESRIGNEYESDACSFISRVFDKGWNPSSEGFFMYDVDGDGLNDIIYSGSTHCAEGDSTLIWFARKDKQGYEIRQDVFWPVLAIRIMPGKQAKFASVSVGCCESIIDEYFSGTLDAMRSSSKSITRDTQLPKHTASNLTVTATKELVLRSSAEQKDEYDKYTSERMEEAVFGNVLSRYLQGCTGTLYGKDTDQNNESWCFISLDKRCNALRSHVAYTVNTGWTTCESLKVK